MIEQLNELIKIAMKAQDKARLSALRYLKSLLLENKTSAKPGPELDVVVRHYKKLSDSIEMYESNPQTQADIKAEMLVISEFMPKQMTQAEVVALILKIKASQTNPNMGSIMKDLTPQIKGCFDGKLANQLVKDNL